jgi:hypothetical protein
MIARKLAIGLIALAPIMASAQVVDAPPPPPGMGGPDDGQRPRFGRFAPATEKDIEEARIFMRENAPNRWQAVESLPDEGSSLRRNVMGFVVARYRMLQGMKEEDPKLYDIKVKQLRVEDELYGMLANTNTPEQRTAMKPELTTAAKKLVELTLQEREQRIAKLKDIVTREEQTLASDQGQVDAKTAARVESLITEGQAALRGDMGGGRRGEHRREWPASQPVSQPALMP